MTDKVQKIREEVERLKSNLIHGACSSQIAMETSCKEEAYNEVLAILDTMQEEPVSEDLEEVSREWLRPQLDKSYANYGEAKMMELTHFDGYAMLDAIEFGAKWKKEEIMAKAIEGRCFSYKNGFVHISCDIDEHLTDIKLGDKVKLIPIKED